jgi:hypothetical protein
MQRRLWATLVIVLAMASGMSDRSSDRPLGLYAQEGHPLSGTWAGDWEGSGGQRIHLTVVMSWDGKAVTGLVNPGPDAIPLTQVVVDWGTWTLRVLGERTDAAAGKPVTIRAEGRLEDIGSSRRRIVGTWTQGDVTGTLTLVRE